MKEKILKNYCYTGLVYGRINKKLGKNLSNTEIEKFIFNILKITKQESFMRKGKNFYIYNNENKVRITVNSNTFRLIKVDTI